jgi:predicted RNase H-like HicB family nuclease
VSVPEVQGCHSHGRTIDQARTRIREALSLFVADRTAAAAEFVEEIGLPKRVDQHVRNVRELRAELEAKRAQLAREERRAVKGLRQEAKLGQRDTGEILGVSFQRVHQLEKAAEQ